MITFKILSYHTTVFYPLTGLISTWLFLYRLLAFSPYFWHCNISLICALYGGFYLFLSFMPVLGIFSIQRFTSLLFNSGKHFWIVFPSFNLFLPFLFLIVSSLQFIYSLFLAFIIYNTGTCSVYPLYLLTLLFPSFYCSVLISGSIAQFYFPGL